MNNYFYIDAKGQQCGPVSGEELKNCGLTRRTLVWCEGMEAWAAADTVAELQPLFVGVPPTPPPPPMPQVAQVVNNTHNQYSSTPRHLELAPSNNLVWSILVTLFCCLSFGVIAIIHASRVDGLWARGMKVEALNEAEFARNWCWAGVTIGLVVRVIYAIFMFSIEY